MAMGMDYDEFWDGKPDRAVAYRKAYKLRRETENEQAWLQGLYIYDAFVVCLSNAFSKRGAKKQQYLEKPLDIFPLTEKEKKRRERQETEKMQKVMEAMILEQRRRKLESGD